MAARLCITLVLLLSLCALTQTTPSDCTSVHNSAFGPICQQTENDTGRQAPLHVTRDATGNLVETLEAPVVPSATLADDLDSLYLSSLPVRLRRSSKTTTKSSEPSGPVHVFRDASGSLVEEAEHEAAPPTEGWSAILDDLYLESAPVRQRSQPRRSAPSEASAGSPGYLHVYKNAQGHLVEEPEAEADAEALLAVTLDALYEDETPLRMRRKARAPAHQNAAVQPESSTTVASEQSSRYDTEAHDPQPLHVYMDDEGALIEEVEEWPIDHIMAHNESFLDSLYYESTAVRISFTTPTAPDDSLSLFDADELDALYAEEMGAGSWDSQPIHVYRDDSGDLVEQEEDIPAEELEQEEVQKLADEIHLGTVPVRTWKATKKVPKAIPAAGMRPSRGLRVAAPRLRLGSKRAASMPKMAGPGLYHKSN